MYAYASEILIDMVGISGKFSRISPFGPDDSQITVSNFFLFINNCRVLVHIPANFIPRYPIGSKSALVQLLV